MLSEIFINLSEIPHFTTLQKFADRIAGTVLERVIANFILPIEVGQIFLATDSTGFKPTNAYSTTPTEPRWGKVRQTVYWSRDMPKQIICTIKIRRAPSRRDNIDFKPMVTKTAQIKPLSILVADKGYDSEENHVLVRDELNAYSSIILPPRYQEVPIWKMHGKYRWKQMKCGGYPKPMYNQRNKDTTIVSVIKRLFGEHITSRLIRTQNRELTFRCIVYNMHRVTNLLVLVLLSTKPAVKAFEIFKRPFSKVRIFEKATGLKYVNTSIRTYVFYEMLSTWLQISNFFVISREARRESNNVNQCNTPTRVSWRFVDP
jgi:hypothetical protein